MAKILFILNFINMTIGDQIKHYRKKKGFTQEKLAKMIGISSKRVIWDYESGRVTPSIKVLESIAEVLDCDLVFELRDKKL